MIVAGVLRSRLRLARNTVLGRGGRSASRRAGGALLAVVLSGALAATVFATLASAFAWLSLQSPEATLAGSLLSLALTAALAALVVLDLHEAMTALLSDSDLALLRRAPLGSAMVFAIKFADSLPRTSSILLVVAVPAVLAYHLSHPLPAWAWLLLPAQLASLWAIPLGLGSAAALVLLRLVPARYVREGFGLLSTLVLAALWLANSFLLPRLGETSVDALASLTRVLDAVPEAYRGSPGRWAALALEGASSGDPVLAVRMTLGLLAAAGGAVALAAGTAALHLDAIQSRLTVHSRRGARRRDVAATTARSTEPRGLVRATLARDARLLSRDWTLLGGVVTTAALWTLLPLVIAPLVTLPGRVLARTMLLALTVALGYEVGARALPLERRAIDWMRLSPVPASRWIAARFAGVALAGGLLFALAAAATLIAFDTPPRTALEILSIAVPALATALATGVWAGAAFGNPGWANPQAMLTLAGRLVALLLLLLQAGLWAALAGALESLEVIPLAARVGLAALLGALGATLALRAAAALCARPRDT